MLCLIQLIVRSAFLALCVLQRRLLLAFLFLCLDTSLIRLGALGVGEVLCRKRLLGEQGVCLCPGIRNSTGLLCVVRCAICFLSCKLFPRQRQFPVFQCDGLVQERTRCIPVC